MKVNEIFASIDGEGIRTGYPVTFIRLFGCNLRCSYCDTMYAVEGDDYTEMTVADIMENVRSQGFKRITLTGGEPLLYIEEVVPLLEALVKEGYEVNIETNGAVPLSPVEPLRKDNKQIIYTLDYKSLSSDMNKAMLLENFALLRDGDVLKFVVGNEDDLDDMRHIVNDVLPPTHGVEIFVSPVFDDIDAADIVDYILNFHMENVRVQLQLHKFIWDPNMRGV